MHPLTEYCQLQTRRHLLQTAGLGIGSMAIQSLLAAEGSQTAVSAPSQPAAPLPLLAPRAKRVI